MESAAARRVPPLPVLLRLGLIGGLLAIAALGWAWTDEKMRGMDHGPGTELGALGFYVIAWVVMMAAMMFPSIAPMVLMHARVMGSRRDRGRVAATGATAAFVAGYMLTWAAAGLLAYAIITAGHALSIAFLAWDRAGPYLAGGVIVAAALYQLTPLKDACLKRCQSPLMFLMSSWRAGRTGSLQMGIEHGAWCVGCCWALMAALFALGVMSVGWMAFIAALIAVEKLLAWRPVVNLGIPVLLVALGILVAFAPQEVPGLTVPGGTSTDR